MYYLDDIMDRTFDNWSMMLGANDSSFWANSEIEMKPESDSEKSTTNAPAETPAWEPADTSEWNETSDDSSSDTATTNTDAVSETLRDFADTASEAIADINPFTDEDRN